MRKGEKEKRRRWENMCSQGIRFVLLLWTFFLSSNPAIAQKIPEIAIIQGAPGEEAYAKKFQRWSDNFSQACKDANRPVLQVNKSKGSKTPKQQIENWLQSHSDTPQNPLWIFLIGHGTYDGKSAKFNLNGPDISATELKSWLQPLKERPVLIINTASSSAPFLTKLSGENRIILTATRSGSEYNSTQLANFLSQNINNPESDLDKDGQTSLLEAWLYSNRELADHYKKDGRIQNEHSLIDDNADSKGTQPKDFTGILPKQKEGDKRPPDGFRAHQFHLKPSDFEKSLSPEQRKKRDALELEIHQLRLQKSKFPEDEYYQKLEGLLRDLGKIYLSAESSENKE